MPSHQFLRNTYICHISSFGLNLQGAVTHHIYSRLNYQKYKEFMQNVMTKMINGEFKGGTIFIAEIKPFLLVFVFNRKLASITGQKSVPFFMDHKF